MSSPLARTGQRARRAVTLCSVLVVAVVAAAGSTAAASGSPSKDAAAGTTTTGAGTKVKKVTVDAPGVTATEIHVGSITSKTNPIGGLNGLLDEGIKAYFNVVNSKGGVWGRKLKLTSQRDDQTANNLTQTEAMLSQDDVYAVFEAAELFSGAKKLAAAGIPTFGWNINAEWAGPKNFFPNHAPICFGKTCSSLGRSLPWIVKQNHRHKVAFLAYSVPQSADSATTGAATVKKFSKQIGADVVYTDTSLAFGQLDFSAQVAQMKDKGVDFLMTSMDGNGDYAVAKEMQNQGILDKVTFFHPNLYDADFVRKNAAVLEGGIVLVAILAAEQKPAPPALKEYLAYAKKHNMKVTEMTLQGWMAARQMVDALKATGPNFTWANLVKTWNKQTYYTNGGLNAPIDWTYQHNDPSESVANRSPFECYNFVKIHNGKFVGIYNGGGSKPWLCFNGKKPDEWQTPANVSFAGKPVDITALAKPAAATGSTTTG
ncbi:MAG: ABC transporter substrate-binding protein [Acidimicrobiia bacterium]